MYAVFTSGGKQYRVEEGDTIRVEKLDAAEGDAVEFDRVLMVKEGDTTKVGGPYLDGCSVSATVKAHGRGAKVRVIKFRRRKNYRRTAGHRQAYTQVRITGISAG